MARRIFVAIPVSKLLQETILLWEEQYANLPVRWLSEKNLHVTLIPPWYEERVDAVCLKLQAFRGMRASFGMEFTRVRFGPDEKNPRLIWAEGEVPRELLSLKDGIEEALGQHGEMRPFRLHLTLARFRPETFSSFPTKKLDERVEWRERPASFVLMESHLSPHGADYEVLKEITLAP